ncbi:integral membrane protein [Sulfurimonas denitrificans DSM 1251]|jgi:membrane protein DedA with SNARE-associated domain|uniref:Integral membrane protein n=2 Tax=Sulfurimonas denitrificans TaxID=39766 RepID=Q30PV9_SULDN|nr:integral membrane protein [Sulfurimonas denitrificans DSM 1251]
MMEDTFSNLATYGYIGLFLYSLGGGFVAIIAAGVMSFMGKMDLSLSITIAFIANALGDFLLFYMARYQKSMMMEGLRKHRRKLALAHIMMKKNGSWIILIQKFVYGIKTLIPIAIGLTKYDFKRFAILNILSAGVWALIFGLGSYYSGGFLMSIAEAITQKPWIAPIILVVFGGALWLYLTQATKRKIKK